MSTAILAATSALAATTSCSLGNPCPESAPCCSQYGQCGVGAYCLGGCDPRMSFSLDSCVPEPVCQSKSMTMDSLDGLVSIEKYLGDSSEADWVYSGEPLVYKDNLILTMANQSAGTVLASTTYMWYGNVKATIKTSRGAGVVTAFILLSDVKDEIDYEFIGVDLTTAQTNFYFQGILDYENSGNITDISDTYNNFHDYEIQWSPDSITWLVDGKVGRSVKRTDYWNATSNQWDFPQSPSRVELSIWPGGDSDNAQGTIDWAGGPIDWDSDDMKNYGYDFMTVSSIEMQCYNASSTPGTNKNKSYYYSSSKATNDSIVDSNNATILASFLGTGTNMEAGASSASASTSIATANTVPGGSSGGVGSSGEAQGAGDSSSGSSGSSTSSSADCHTTGFTQSCDGGSTKTSAATGQENIFGGSAVAAIVAFVFLLWL